jgi:VWFA-related protein
VRWISAATIAVALASQTAQPPPQPPTFKTEANYVRVDAYPTRDGQPVLDLRQDEFEIVEDGVSQKIDAFEHVVIRAAGPQETRHEPNTVAESRAALENPRARVFVVFLDVYHVEVGGSHNIRKPLIDTLNRVIGQEDLVGIMTPEMTARDVTFARRTTTIEGMLTNYWTWGERDQISNRDREDQNYARCYPDVAPPDRCADQNGIALEMIDRRHERRTIDALEDLVQFLRGVREERKAILVITDGWLLYRPDERLARPLKCHGTPGTPQVFIDPRTGRPTTKQDVRSGTDATEYRCETDRAGLARLDNATDFRRILDEANRANASFYPVDPRGLVVFDEPLMRMTGAGPPPPVVPVTVDAARLRGRLDSLRTLAAATDGIAVLDSNDLNHGLKRIVDDLTSYYLLGYYSSGKLDGKFHSITVRVKRPGVQVRARRGYQAPTAAEVAAASRTAAPATPEEAAAAAEKAVVDAALAPLGKFQRESAFNIRVAAGWKPQSTASAVVWVAGELAGSAAYAQEWREGATAEVVLKADDGSSAGTTVATSQLKIDRGARSFRVALETAPGAAPIDAGDYTVRVTARGATAPSLPSTDVLHFTLPPAPGAVGALLARRGPATANREVPTADLRFRRNEQVRVELPTSETAAMTGRLLDRTGKPLPVTIATASRDDADGSRWITAQIALAPLAVGDYIIELTAAGAGREKERRLVAFRVIP